jgi:hypothetical protein
MARTLSLPGTIIIVSDRACIDLVFAARGSGTWTAAESSAAATCRRAPDSGADEIASHGLSMRWRRLPRETRRCALDRRAAR